MWEGARRACSAASTKNNSITTRHESSTSFKLHTPGIFFISWSAHFHPDEEAYANMLQASLSPESLLKSLVVPNTTTRLTQNYG